MKPLYTTKQFETATNKDLLPCQCYNCGSSFLKTKARIKESFHPNSTSTLEYCSKECSYPSKSKSVTYNCHLCNKECKKKLSQVKLSKSGYNFCSRSCTSTYHIRHKTYGTNRSKLEIWIEVQLQRLYPDLNILYNDNKILNGLELDIYIPSLKLAFELNGIFHYEPIFGSDKLHKTQNKDNSKTKLCIDNEIDLCVIDTTHQKYFKEHTSNKYLNIITTIINQR